MSIDPDGVICRSENFQWETNLKLTVEIRDKNSDSPEIEIYCDKEGISILIAELEKLKSSTGPSHLHLATPSWAGHELTENLQGSDTELINQVTIRFIK